MKKGLVITLSIIGAVIVLALALYFFGIGFTKMNNVFLADYSVEEDTGTITLNTMVGTSIGYTRAITTREEDGAMYVTFYSAFGGINGNWGARSSFEITPDADCEKIYFNAYDDWNLTLEKDEDGVWQMP